jgi:hypothetical protein
LLVIDLPHSDRENVDSELPVSRINLRRILSEGLGDIVHYGKKFPRLPQRQCRPHGGSGGRCSIRLVVLRL